MSGGEFMLLIIYEIFNFSNLCCTEDLFAYQEWIEAVLGNCYTFASGIEVDYYNNPDSYV